MTHEIGKAGRRENHLIWEVKRGIPHHIVDVKVKVKSLSHV